MIFTTVTQQRASGGGWKKYIDLDSAGEALFAVGEKVQVMIEKVPEPWVVEVAPIVYGDAPQRSTEIPETFVTRAQAQAAIDFILLNKQCVDNYFYATRAAVREAIRPARYFRYLDIFRLPGVSTVVPRFSIRVSWASGRLSMGCHTFNREQSKKILKWAKAK